jgi:hypothetical protein
VQVHAEWAKLGDAYFPLYVEVEMKGVTVGTKKAHGEKSAIFDFRFGVWGKMATITASRNNHVLLVPLP